MIECVSAHFTPLLVIRGLTALLVCVCCCCGQLQANTRCFMSFLSGITFEVLTDVDGRSLLLIRLLLMVKVNPVLCCLVSVVIAVGVACSACMLRMVWDMAAFICLYAQRGTTQRCVALVQCLFRGELLLRRVVLDNPSGGCIAYLTLLVEFCYDRTVKAKYGNPPCLQRYEQQTVGWRLVAATFVGVCFFSHLLLFSLLFSV